MKKTLISILSLIVFAFCMPVMVDAVTVAKIGDEEYETIEEALTSVTSEETTIDVLENTETIYIAEGQNVVLNIKSGVSIYSIENAGVLKITGDGMITDVTNNGTLVINGGIYSDNTLIGNVNQGYGMYQVKYNNEDCYAVYATGEVVARVGSYYYTSILEALENGSKTEAVILVNNVTIDSVITLNKDVTINLNTYSITASDKQVFDVIKGQIKLTGEGSVIGGANSGYAVRLAGSYKDEANYTHLIVDEDVTLEGKLYGLMVTYYKSIHTTSSSMDAYGVVMDIYGTVIGNTYTAIYVNGSINNVGENSVKLNVYGANLQGPNGGIYAAGYALINLEDVNITGRTPIEVRAGKLTIDGGVYTATSNFSAESNNNGSTTKGAALAISQHTTDLPIEVNIISGRFVAEEEGSKALSEDDYENTTGRDKIKLSISEDVVFDGPVDLADFAFGIKEGKTITFSQKSLSEVISTLDENQSIVLYKDIEVNDTIKVENDLTIDLNGFDITGTNKQVFDLAKGEFKLTGEGIVTGGPNSVYAIRTVGSNENVANYSHLIIDEDVTVTSPGYGIIVSYHNSVNGGTSYDAYGLTLDIYGTVIGQRYGALYVNGTVKTTGDNMVKINAENATLTNGIYAAGNAKWNIKNTNIDGNTAIEIRAGIMNIDGGTITATGEYSGAANNNGSTMTGVALALSQHDPDYSVSVNVKNATLVNTNENGKAIVEYDFQNETGRNLISLSLENVTYEGEVEYDNFVATATKGDKITYLSDFSKIDDLATGNTVKLLRNIEVADTIKITKDLTINLNGYSITGTNKHVFDLAKGEFKLTGNGTVTGGPKGVYAIRATGSNEDVANYSHLIIDKDVTVTSPGYGVIVNYHSSVNGGSSYDAYGLTVDIYGTVIGQDYGAVYLNGTVQTAGQNMVKFNIENATLTGKGIGIYAAGNAEWNIKNATVTGATAIEIRGGVLNVDGGKYIASGSYKGDENGNGTTTIGAALAISQHTTDLPIQVNLEGNALFIASNENGKSLVEKDFQNETGRNLISLNIYAAQFNKAVEIENVRYIYNNVVLEKENALYIYKTINEVLENAEDGDTINIYNDIEDSNIAIDKNLTINFNGYSLEGVKGFDVAYNKANTKLVLKNGSMQTERWAIWLQNGAQVTVEDDFVITANTSNGNSTPGIAVTSNSTLDFYGTITASKFAISGNGNAGQGNTVINIYDGAYVRSTTDSAVYHPQFGVFNMTGGKLVGADSAIAIKSGEFNISGGTVYSTGKFIKQPLANNNGSEETGAAISISSNDAYKEYVTLNITGGTIKGKYAPAIYEFIPYNSDNELAATATHLKSINIGDEATITSVTNDKDIILQNYTITDIPEITLEDVTYNSIEISWTPKDNITGYRIYRSTDNKTFKVIKTITDLDVTSFKDTSVIPNTYYYYKVKVYDKMNSLTLFSNYSNSVSARPIIDNPDTMGTNTYFRFARVNIEKVEGATGYVVYRSESENGTYKNIGTTKSSYYADKTAEEGKEYFYKVRSYITINEKNYYSFISTAQAVSAMRLSDEITYKLTPGFQKVTITINEVEGANEYYVYRATSEYGSYTKVATISSSEINNGQIIYADKASFNRTYYYKIQLKGATTSAYSEVKSTKTKLTVPSYTVEEPIEGTRPLITIDKLEGAQYYEIYRSYNKKKYILLTTTKELTYNAYVNTNYDTVYFRVRAYRLQNGKKVYSTVRTITYTPTVNE